MQRLPLARRDPNLRATSAVHLSHFDIFIPTFDACLMIY
jgi:hypothetical protein